MHENKKGARGWNTDFDGKCTDYDRHIAFFFVIFYSYYDLESCGALYRSAALFRCGKTEKAAQS